MLVVTTHGEVGIYRENSLAGPTSAVMHTDRGIRHSSVLSGYADAWRACRLQNKSLYAPTGWEGLFLCVFPQG